MKHSSCNCSNSSPFYALSSISFYDTKPKIGFMWVKLQAFLKTCMIVLGDPKGIVAVNASHQLWSVPRSTVLGFVACNENQSPLSWKEDILSKCQVQKLHNSIWMLTQEFLNWSVLMLYQTSCIQSSMGPF